MRRYTVYSLRLVWRLRVYPGQGMVRLVKNPLGSAEAAVRDQPPTAVGLYLLRQEDGVALHHQIHVDGRRLSTCVYAAQYQVPHKPANDVHSMSQFGRGLADNSEKPVLRLSQGLLKLAADVWNLRLRLPVLAPKFKQICARDDAC